MPKPTAGARRRLAALVSCLLAATACTKGHNDDSGDKSTNEGPRDFIRLEPGSAPLDFIKIEAVAESVGDTSVTLPGRVSFDEDHTQRVAYPGETFPGKIGHVGDVVNKTHRLKPEMFAKVDVLNAAGHKLTLVPAQAVLNDGDKSLVIVASEGNMFRPRRVDVGPEVDGKVRVLGGVRAGEKIVTDGAIFMKRELDSQ